MRTLSEDLRLRAVRLVIDESGVSTKMARLRGRSMRGERCPAAVPHGHWKTITLVAGLRLKGVFCAAYRRRLNH